MESPPSFRDRTIKVRCHNAFARSHTPPRSHERSHKGSAWMLVDAFVRMRSVRPAPDAPLPLTTSSPTHPSAFSRTQPQRQRLDARGCIRQNAFSTPGPRRTIASHHVTAHTPLRVLTNAATKAALGCSWMHSSECVQYARPPTHHCLSPRHRPHTPPRSHERSHKGSAWMLVDAFVRMRSVRPAPRRTIASHHVTAHTLLRVLTNAATKAALGTHLPHTAPEKTSAGRCCTRSTTPGPLDQEICSGKAPAQ